MMPVNIKKSGAVRVGSIRANITEKIDVSNIKVLELTSQKSGMGKAVSNIS